MENTEEFQSCLFRLLLDAKRKLGMSDRTIAFILLREGMNYFLRLIMEEEAKHNGV